LGRCFNAKLLVAEYHFYNELSITKKSKKMGMQHFAPPVDSAKSMAKAKTQAVNPEHRPLG